MRSPPRLLPVMSNQTGVSAFSMAITPTMWETGSLSMTLKEYALSSKASGAALGSGFGIHSMCSRQVDDFWGRPLSTALIWKTRGSETPVPLTAEYLRRRDWTALISAAEAASRVRCGEPDYYKSTLQNHPGCHSIYSNNLFHCRLIS